MDTEAAARTHVTREVEPAAVRRVLDAPPRATVAFVDGDRAELLPVRTRCGVGRYLFGVVADGAPDLEGREVVLVVDGGAYWFELCGTSVRGVAAHVDRPAGLDGLHWYAIAPRRVLAWDYAAIREE
jgi:hypothetical protein